MIIGYKCFKKGLINHYGMKFEIGKTYKATGPIKFGIYGNGFHMCEFLEDTFRYYLDEEEPILCLVEGSGESVQYDDDYFGYYNMHSVEYLKIIRIIEREEIINYFLKLVDLRLCKALQTFKFTDEELMLFKERFKNNSNILKSIYYYQEGGLELLLKRNKKN